MAAAPRNTFNEIEREITEIDNSLGQYTIARQNFLLELHALFNAWVDTLANCPETERGERAEELGITEDQLDGLIDRLRAINRNIQTNSNFDGEVENIMQFIERYRNVLAKIPGVAVPPPDAADTDYLRSQPPGKIDATLGRIRTGASASASVAPSIGSSSAAFAPELPNVGRRVMYSVPGSSHPIQGIVVNINPNNTVNIRRDNGVVDHGITLDKIHVGGVAGGKKSRKLKQKKGTKKRMNKSKKSKKYKK